MDVLPLFRDARTSPPNQATLDISQFRSRCLSTVLWPGRCSCRLLVPFGCDAPATDMSMHEAEARVKSRHVHVTILVLLLGFGSGATESTPRAIK